VTIVVSIRVNDGIVLATDSATSFVDAAGQVVKVYNNANKLFNLVKIWPIGAMTYGSGSIGSASISTLSKDLRKKLTPGFGDPVYALNQNAYTVEEVAEKAKLFFQACYTQAYPQPVPNFLLGYRVCGYSSDGVLPEAWEIKILEHGAEGPVRLYEDDSFGPRWQGETEAIDRLVLGVGSRIYEALGQIGLDAAAAQTMGNALITRLCANLYLPAMPIQDAIDLARFLVDAASKFSHFLLRPATVGGPMEIATITKHEGFRWITRKHYYTQEFNREG